MLVYTAKRLRWNTKEIYTKLLGHSLKIGMFLGTEMWRTSTLEVRKASKDNDIKQRKRALNAFLETN